MSAKKSKKIKIAIKEKDIENKTKSPRKDTSIDNDCMQNETSEQQKTSDNLFASLTLKSGEVISIHSKDK
jgi:hypothetical protein